jgi:hypothetical protein
MRFLRDYFILWAELGALTSALFQLHTLNELEGFFFFFAFAQRARIAFWAISRRCSGVSLFGRAWC